MLYMKKSFEAQIDKLRESESFHHIQLSEIKQQLSTTSERLSEEERGTSQLCEDSLTINDENNRLKDLVAHLKTNLLMQAQSTENDVTEQQSLMNALRKRLELQELEANNYRAGAIRRSLTAQQEITSLKSDISKLEAEITTTLKNHTTECEELEQRLNASHETSLQEAQEEWVSLLSVVRQQVQHCDSDIRLSAAREARKTELLEEYQSAIQQIESERDGLLHMVREAESTNDDMSVHSLQVD